ncbi:MAG: helix-turn-helix transcriptional regulator [bacterium]
MNLNEKIANRIIELRTKQGLTLEKLAYFSEISKSTLSEIESAKSELKVATLYKITEALEISLEDFFKGF